MVEPSTMPSHPTREGIDFLAGEFYAEDPHAHWRWMREHAPVYFDEAAGVWGVTRYADVMAISRDPETFSSAQGIRPDNGPMPMMIDMDDPEHLRRRKLVNRGFTPRRVRGREAFVRATCDRILDRVCARGSCDGVWDIAAPLPLIMIADMLGMPPDEHETLLRWSDDLLRGLNPNDPEAAMRAWRAHEEWTAFITAEIARRRAVGPAGGGSEGADLLDVLVHAEIDGERLTDEELVSEILLILIGGDETTRHVISGGLYELAARPEQRRWLAERPEAIPVAVEEMLRWVSPIKNMARVATRDVELRGQPVRAGQKLLLFYPSANRDAEVFERPDEFVVDRDPNPHVAFGGHGAHHCLGANLARLELVVMFERVLARLPDLELDLGAEPLPVRPANFISGYEALPLRFAPSAPSEV